MFGALWTNTDMKEKTIDTKHKAVVCPKAHGRLLLKTEANMKTVDRIRAEIVKLYRTDPNIHIDVSMNRPRVRISNQEARIKSVYPHIFNIETQGKCYSVQYTEILTKNVRIVELEEHNV